MSHRKGKFYGLVAYTYVCCSPPVVICLLVLFCITLGRVVTPDFNRSGNLLFNSVLD